MGNMEWAAKWVFYFGFIGLFASIALRTEAQNPYALAIFGGILISPYLWILFEKGRRSAKESTGAN